MKRLLLVFAILLAPPLDAQSTWESAAWGKLPAGLEWEAASQVSTTPDGQIVVLRRANPFFVVLTPAGDVVRTWGENLFRVAHGLRIDRKGFLWVTDNADNFVQKYSPEGKLLLTLGQRGAAGGNDSKTNFDGPADVFVLPDGDILVADGYRNSRIVRFASDGTFSSPTRADASSSLMPRTAGFRCSIRAESSSSNGPTSRPSRADRCSSPPTTRST
jgi:hypothetical protein